MDWLKGLLLMAFIFVPLERLLAWHPEQRVFSRGWLNDMIHLLLNGQMTSFWLGFSDVAIGAYIILYGRQSLIHSNVRNNFGPLRCCSPRRNFIIGTTAGTVKPTTRTLPLHCPCTMSCLGRCTCRVARYRANTDWTSQFRDLSGAAALSIPQHSHVQNRIALGFELWIPRAYVSGLYQQLDTDAITEEAGGCTVRLANLHAIH